MSQTVRAPAIQDAAVSRINGLGASRPPFVGHPLFPKFSPELLLKS